MQRWQYYVSSYVRVEDTEGVDHSKMSPIFRAQMARYHDLVELEDHPIPEEVQHGDNLVLRICVNTSKIMYKKFTSDSFAYTSKRSAANLAKITEARNQRFRERFVQNNKWMQGKSHDEVHGYTANFMKMVDGIPVEAPVVAESIEV